MLLIVWSVLRKPKHTVTANPSTYIYTHPHSEKTNYNTLTVISELPALAGAWMRRPLSRSEAWKGAWHVIMCDFKRGMLGCALLQRWHRNSFDRRLSSFMDALPYFSSSSITSTESRKNSVLKEFQCFLCFKCCESKSWLITWRCNCLIDGTE